MPIQKTTSPLAKYRKAIDAAAKEHAGDPIDYGFQRLPGGITNAVAKLVECTFGTVAQGKQNAGEPYWRAAGVVVSPAEAPDGTPILGLQTSIMEMICDTKNSKGEVTTLKQHVVSIMNEMKKLGGPDLDVTDLEAAAAALKEAGPYFRFSTSSGKATPEYPTPRVFENWHGSKGLEDYAPEEAGVVDERTETPPARNGTAARRQAKAEEVEAADDEPAAEEFDEFGDIDSLVAKAEEQDKKAQEQLKEFALKAGASEEDVDNAGSWQEVADMIGSGAAADDEPAEEAAAPEPAEGDVYLYSPIDPKTKKPFVDAKTKKPRKPVEVEVLSVDKKTSTCTVKSLDDGKTQWKGVAFDDLKASD